MSGVKLDSINFWAQKYGELSMQDINYGAQAYVGFLILSRALVDVLDQPEVWDYEAVEDVLKYAHGENYRDIIDNIVGNCSVTELLEELKREAGAGEQDQQHVQRDDAESSGQEQDGGAV